MHWSWNASWTATSTVVLSLASIVTSAGAAEAADFATQVWPIVEAHCLECHGPRQKYSNLRLDSPAAIERGGELGPVLVPGSAVESPLYRRVILAPDDLDFMPVDGEPLTAQETDALRRWIDEGADFSGWSGVLEEDRH